MVIHINIISNIENTVFYMVNIGCRWAGNIESFLLHKKWGNNE